jgi:hypothetical protein
MQKRVNLLLGTAETTRGRHKALQREAKPNRREFSQKVAPVTLRESQLQQQRRPRASMEALLVVNQSGRYIQVQLSIIRQISNLKGSLNSTSQWRQERRISEPRESMESLNNNKVSLQLKTQVKSPIILNNVKPCGNPTTHLRS